MLDVGCWMLKPHHRCFIMLLIVVVACFLLCMVFIHDYNYDNKHKHHRKQKTPEILIEPNSLVKDQLHLTCLPHTRDAYNNPLNNTKYVSNDNWKYLCNDDNVIFIPTDQLLDKYNITYLQKIQKPFVLVTATNVAQSSMTSNHVDIINIPNLLHWFGTHPGEVHSKFSPLPLGPKWNWKSTEFDSKVEEFDKSIHTFNEACMNVESTFGHSNRNILMYWNMNKNTTNNPQYTKHHKNIRHTIFESLNNNGLIISDHKQKEWSDYLSDLRNSVFCVSPPGNGPDAHRTWEALSMGCIPLVSSYEPLNLIYEDLPVVIVDNWSQITNEYLLKKQKEIYFRMKNTHPSNLQKLNLDYWSEKIYACLHNYRAVIVEPRPHKALKPVLNNICQKLGCPITIVHGAKNKKYVLEAAKDIPCVDLILEINAEQLNAPTYSKLLTTEEFWDKTRKKEQTILIFQTDSGICGESKDIHKFLQYDYCGAPWGNGKVGGNGGFSIRNPEIAKKHICEHGTSTKNEDAMFSKWCEDDNKCKICPLKIGKEFCTEAVKSQAWAFHNNWRYTKERNLCEFNEHIAKLNISQPASHYNIPSDDWKPTFTVSIDKGLA